MTRGPTISIVITSRENSSAKKLMLLLERLSELTYSQAEFIVVIEGSSVLFAMVQAKAKSSARSKINCYLVPEGIGASASRNIGIRHSTGELIAFLDDDVVVPKSWANEVVQTFALSDSIIGMVGPVLPSWWSVDMNWFPNELLWLVSCTGWLGYSRVVPIVGHTWTSNATFRREAFTDRTMFSEDLGPRGGTPGWRRRHVSEDVELSVRIQHSSRRAVVFSPGCWVWKQIPPSALSWTHIQECAFGIGISRVSKRQLVSAEIGQVYQTEAKLLKGILLRLMPISVVDILTRRHHGWRKLSLSFFALFFLAVGFLYGSVFGVNIGDPCARG